MFILAANFLLSIFFLIIGASTCNAQAPNLRLDFDQANKLYEQGRYKDAVVAYQRILQTGHASAELHFNLGNAWFKTGQIGKSIFHFQLAQRSAPRDPDIRANLQFARESIPGGVQPGLGQWRRWASLISLDEWAVLAVVAFWTWSAMLIAREINPLWKHTLKGYTSAVGSLTLFVALALGVLAWQRLYLQTAVAVVPEAVVRYGPLDDSQSYFTARDGAELRVLARQNHWLQVKDAKHRMGWLKQEQAWVIPAGSTGDPPVPSGDPPDGTARRLEP